MQNQSSPHPFDALSPGFSKPQRTYAPMPFWFLNDDLDADKIKRQIVDFYAHGVGGMVLHPRVGLPRSLGWMSESLLGYLRVAIEEADRLGLSIILYDEGMYPSGSSCGQVVASNPEYACRGLDYTLVQEGQKFELPAGANLVAQTVTASGQTMIVYDRKIESSIRGLHFEDHNHPRLEPRADGQYHDPPEDHPAAGDLLNPDAMAKFIELVYQKYHDAFGKYFGNTIMAIFTDEPGVLGKCAESDRVRPGTKGILPHVNRILDYDFTPHLPALWFDDEPDAVAYRKDWDRAINARLEETYYQPIRQWCDAHNIQLTGHPGESDDISMERHFHIPGQDLVWRYVQPGDDSALIGPHSTMAKCASSAMVHLGAKRNLNEIFGAYGHDLNFDEVQWLANWALIRGQNLLVPHAFYYSTRGPRVDERPPDVGPNSPWWGRFKNWAEHVSRLCYLNTVGQQQCQIAVLCGPSHLPDLRVKPLYENQLDFNYIMGSDLLKKDCVRDDGIHIQQMHYQVLLIDGSVPITPELEPVMQQLADAGRLIDHRNVPDLITHLQTFAPAIIKLDKTAPDLRLRHVIADGAHWIMLFNEGNKTLDLAGSLCLPANQITLVNVYQQATESLTSQFSFSIPTGQMQIIHCPKKDY